VLNDKAVGPVNPLRGGPPGGSFLRVSDVLRNWGWASHASGLTGRNNGSMISQEDEDGEDYLSREAGS
jgi:hypothetical protein